ncbi:hypothetical protein EGW08_017467 [Elysia chlorotica]|uniref:Uncharacterized protein n=1 Tax=Elysia chlorotica TaxID=188477 RepID=A0A433SZN5_ELYCH|nr:hypothetical protein EGW08_017467 [Elysia chlorotica]
MSFIDKTYRHRAVSGSGYSGGHGSIHLPTIQLSKMFTVEATAQYIYLLSNYPRCLQWRPRLSTSTYYPTIQDVYSGGHGSVHLPTIQLSKMFTVEATAQYIYLLSNYPRCLQWRPRLSTCTYYPTIQDVYSGGHGSVHLPTIQLSKMFTVEATAQYIYLLSNYPRCLQWRPRLSTSTYYPTIQDVYSGGHGSVHLPTIQLSKMVTVEATAQYIYLLSNYPRCLQWRPRFSTSTYYPTIQDVYSGGHGSVHLPTIQLSKMFTVEATAQYKNTYYPTIQDDYSGGHSSIHIPTIQLSKMITVEATNQ